MTPSPSAGPAQEDASGLARWGIGVQPGLCPPLRFNEATCLRCAEACPRGAIRIGERIAVSSGCDGCGVCVAACPNSVFVPREAELSGLLERVRQIRGGEPSEVFRCSQALSEDHSVDVPCLGAISPYVLLAAVEAGAQMIRLVRGDCGGCKWERGVAQFDATLLSFTSLCEALGISINANVSDAPALEAAASAGFSTQRRSAFRLLARPFRRTAESTNQGQQRRSGVWKRDLLLRSLRAIAPRRNGELRHGQTGFCMIALGPGCSACGLCALACPAAAIRSTESEEALALTFEPALCTGCGTCAKVCPIGCICFLPADLRSVVRGKRMVLQRFSLTICRGCGTAFVSSQHQLCDVCSKRGGLHA